jgi:hypothetical protein
MRLGKAAMHARIRGSTGEEGPVQRDECDVNVGEEAQELGGICALVGDRDGFLLWPSPDVI